MNDLLFLIPALPLAGFLVLVFLGRRLGEPLAGWLATAAVGSSFLVVVAVFFDLLGKDAHERALTQTLFTWLPVGGLQVDLGFLADPLGPLAIRWSYLPKVLPWLARYLASGWTEARVARTAVALRAMLRDAPALHAALAEEAGVAGLIERRGLMYVYPSRAEFAAEAMAWRIRRQVGIEWLELSADELRQREPGLDRRYGFAALVEDAKASGLVVEELDTEAVVRFCHAVGFGFLLFGAIDLHQPQAGPWEQLIAQLVRALGQPVDPTAPGD